MYAYNWLIFAFGDILFFIAKKSMQKSLGKIIRHLILPH